MKKLLFSLCTVSLLYITHHTVSNASSSKSNDAGFALLIGLTGGERDGKPEKPVPTPNTHTSSTTAPEAYRIDGIVAGTNAASLIVGGAAARAHKEHGTFAGSNQYGN